MGPVVEAGQVGIGDLAPEADPVGEAQTGGQRGPLLPHRPLPHNLQIDSGQFGQCFQKGIHPLVVPQFPHKEQRRRAVVGGGGRDETAMVHSQRDNGALFPHEPQPWRSLYVAGTGGDNPVSMSQDPPQQGAVEAQPPPLADHVGVVSDDGRLGPAQDVVCQFAQRIGGMDVNDVGAQTGQTERLAQA